MTVRLVPERSLASKLLIRKGLTAYAASLYIHSIPRKVALVKKSLSAVYLILRNTAVCTGRLDFSPQNGYNKTIIIVIYAMTQEK